MKKIETITEILLLLGFILLGIGLYMIYKPSMFVGCGAILMYIGWPKGVNNEPDN